MYLIALACICIKIYYDGVFPSPFQAWTWYLRDQKFIHRR